MWPRVTLGLGGIATLLAASRLIVQRVLSGAWAIYTDMSKIFYAQDPLLGWSPAQETWVWLGLDALGAVVAAAGLAVGLTWWSRRQRQGGGRARGAGAARFGALASAVAAALAMVWAWSSGLPGQGLSTRVPQATYAVDAGAADAFATGSAASYLSQDAFAQVTAHVSAGGEQFDVHFGAPSGAVRFAPTALIDQAPVGSFELDVQTLDTGVRLRTKHAKTYLDADRYPTIGLELGELTATSLDATRAHIDFHMRGTLQFMGVALETPIEGRITQLAASQRQELGLTAPEAYLLQATMQLHIPETPLAEHASAFDAPTIQLSVRLVLTAAPSPSAASPLPPSSAASASGPSLRQRITRRDARVVTPATACGRNLNSVGRSSPASPP